jgi:hypothetical protein
MARLQTGTRIYGTANVDTSVTIGTGVGNTVVFANSTTITVGNTTSGNVTIITASSISGASGWGQLYASRSIFF